MSMAASRTKSPATSRAHPDPKRKKAAGSRGTASSFDEAASDIDDRRIQQGSYSDRASSGRKAPASHDKD